MDALRRRNIIDLVLLIFSHHDTAALFRIKDSSDHLIQIAVFEKNLEQGVQPTVVVFCSWIYFWIYWFLYNPLENPGFFGF